MIATRLLSHAIALLWLVLSSNWFFIFTLAILAWMLLLLVGYGGWIVGGWVVQVLDDLMRVILQIR